MQPQQQQQKKQDRGRRHSDVDAAGCGAVLTSYPQARRAQTLTPNARIFFLEVFSYKWILSPLGGTLH
jgi:hypothetical protein